MVSLAPQELIVDSFPGGILGELRGIDLPPAVHVARRLRWDVYRRRLRGPLPRFRKTFVVESLTPEHEHALSGFSSESERLELPAIGQAPADLLLDGAHWLVVHSGPDHETVELAQYAAELQVLERSPAPILVISPVRPSWIPAGGTWRDLYPVAGHFERAERIVTAAGFNAIRETELVRERHRCIPFERKLDDQFGRAAAMQKNRQQQAGLDVAEAS
jgi:hypothetical protein